MYQMTPLYLSEVFAGGVVVLFGSRYLVRFTLLHIAPWNQAKPPGGVLPEEWQAVIRGTGANSASWLGALECLLAYLAFVIFQDSAAPIIGGWLAFKVASKWESWQNVIQPEYLTKG